jgi:hypothetical protein
MSGRVCLDRFVLSAVGVRVLCVFCAGCMCHLYAFAFFILVCVPCVCLCKIRIGRKAWCLEGGLAHVVMVGDKLLRQWRALSRVSLSCFLFGLIWSGLFSLLHLSFLSLE